MLKILGTSHLLPAGGWGGGLVTFSCAVQKFLRPSPQSHWKKNLNPLDLWQKSLCPPPQNSQYSSPQTQSFIFALNINIATTIWR